MLHERLASGKAHRKVCEYWWQGWADYCCGWRMIISWISVDRVTRMRLVSKKIRSKRDRKHNTDWWPIRVSDEPVLEIQLTATTTTGIVFQLASIEHQNNQLADNERWSRGRGRQSRGSEISKWERNLSRERNGREWKSRELVDLNEIQNQQSVGPMSFGGGRLGWSPPQIVCGTLRKMSRNQPKIKSSIGT